MSLTIGFALALLIGVTLGMLGAGGSILTVPVFVYVMGIEAKSAIVMSFPVVGMTSLVGAAGHWREGNLDWRVAIVFAPLAMGGAVAGAQLAERVSGGFQLALLGVVMVAAGVLMLRGRPAPDRRSASAASHRAVLACVALFVGVLTGLVGVGGGFLIVPALVLLGGVPIKRAVGTSLLVIASSTVTGLVAYRGPAAISWPVVALFTGLAVAGTLAGTRLVRYVPAASLRRAFGVLVLGLATLLLYQNRGVFAAAAGRAQSRSVR